MMRWWGVTSERRRSNCSSFVWVICSCEVLCNKACHPGSHYCDFPDALKVRSLGLIWITGTCIFHLWVTTLQMRLAHIFRCQIWWPWYVILVHTPKLVTFSTTRLGGLDILKLMLWNILKINNHFMTADQPSQKLLSEHRPFGGKIPTLEWN